MSTMMSDDRPGAPPELSFEQSLPPQVRQGLQRLLDRGAVYDSATQMFTVGPKRHSLKDLVDPDSGASIRYLLELALSPPRDTDVHDLATLLAALAEAHTEVVHREDELERGLRAEQGNPFTTQLASRVADNEAHEEEFERQAREEARIAHDTLEQVRHQVAVLQQGQVDLNHVVDFHHAELTNGMEALRSDGRSTSAQLADLIRLHEAAGRRQEQFQIDMSAQMQRLSQTLTGRLATVEQRIVQPQPVQSQPPPAVVPKVIQAPVPSPVSHVSALLPQSAVELFVSRLSKNEKIILTIESNGRSQTFYGQVTDRSSNLVATIKLYGDRLLKEYKYEVQLPNPSLSIVRLEPFTGDASYLEEVMTRSALDFVITDYSTWEKFLHSPATAVTLIGALYRFGGFTPERSVQYIFMDQVKDMILKCVDGGGHWQVGFTDPMNSCLIQLYAQHFRCVSKHANGFTGDDAAQAFFEEYHQDPSGTLVERIRRAMDHATIRGKKVFPQRTIMPGGPGTNCLYSQ